MEGKIPLNVLKEFWCLSLTTRQAAKQKSIANYHSDIAGNFPAQKFRTVLLHVAVSHWHLVAHTTTAKLMHTFIFRAHPEPPLCKTSSKQRIPASIQSISENQCHQSIFPHS